MVQSSGVLNVLPVLVVVIPWVTQNLINQGLATSAAISLHGSVGAPGGWSAVENIGGSPASDRAHYSHYRLTMARSLGSKSTGPVTLSLSVPDQNSHRWARTAAAWPPGMCFSVDVSEQQVFPETLDAEQALMLPLLSENHIQRDGRLQMFVDMFKESVRTRGDPLLDPDY